jgi:hypothetical protein
MRKNAGGQAAVAEQLDVLEVVKNKAVAEASKVIEEGGSESYNELQGRAAVLPIAAARVEGRRFASRNLCGLPG